MDPIGHNITGKSDIAIHTKDYLINISDLVQRTFTTNRGRRLIICNYLSVYSSDTITL